MDKIALTKRHRLVGSENKIHIYAVYRRPMDTYRLKVRQWEKVFQRCKANPSKIRNKTSMSTLTSFIQHIFRSSSYSNLRRKRSKGNPSWKEVN